MASRQRDAGRAACGVRGCEVKARCPMAGGAEMETVFARVAQEHYPIGRANSATALRAVKEKWWHAARR